MDKPNAAPAPCLCGRQTCGECRGKAAPAPDAAPPRGCDQYTPKGFADECLRCGRPSADHVAAPAPDAQPSTDGAESRRAGHAPTIGPSPSTNAAPDDLVRLLHAASDGFSSVKLDGVAKLCHDAATMIAAQAAQIAELDADYGRACRTIALMHSAAVGKIGDGPKRGAIEDGEDVRLRAERAERDLSAARAAIAAASELLTHARCPQKCTNGTTPYGEQCQWCDERDRLRAAMGDGNGAARKGEV